MARPPTLAHRERSGSLYFRYRKKEWRVGPADEWTPEGIERYRQDTLAAIRAETWPGPPLSARPPTNPSDLPTMLEAGSDYLAVKRTTHSKRNAEILEGRIETHLGPYFGRTRMDLITLDQVIKYMDYKVQQREDIEAVYARIKDGAEPDDLHPAERKLLKSKQRGLSNNTLNATLSTLSAIWEFTANNHPDLMPRRNPLRSDDARMSRDPVDRSWLDPDQIQAVLDAAVERDATMPKPAERRLGRGALVATLICAGLRIDEAMELRWRDINLTTGRIRVKGRTTAASKARRRTKTAAGQRTVGVSAFLCDILREHGEQAFDATQAALVFGTSKGTKQSDDNFRNRPLAWILARADELLAERGQPALPSVEIGEEERCAITPHAFRRTFATMHVERGATASWLMQAMGHSDSRMTLEVYAQSDSEARSFGDDTHVQRWFTPVAAGATAGVEAGEAAAT